MSRAPGGRHLLVGLSSAVIAAAVIWGLLIVGSPRTAREQRLDAQRVGELRRIAYAVDEHWRQTEALPASLDELSRERGVSLSTADPETGEAYEYRVLDERSYELCARFQRPSEGASGEDEERFWDHGAGRQCFPCTAKHLAP